MLQALLDFRPAGLFLYRAKRGVSFRFILLTIWPLSPEFIHFSLLISSEKFVFFDF